MNKRFVGLSFAVLSLIFIFAGAGIFKKDLINRAIADNKETPAYYINGMGYASEGEFIKAEDQFKKALEINKFDYFSKSALEILEDINKGLITKEYALCFFKGVRYSENKEYPQAIKEFQNAISINPDYAKAYNCLGNVYHSLKKPLEAITYYEKAIRVNPNYSKAYTNLGGEYFILGQYEKAITYSERSAQINPNDAKNYYNLGLAYKALGKGQESEANFKKAKGLIQ